MEKNGGEEIERADWMGDGRVKLANDVTYKRCVSMSATPPAYLSNPWLMGKLT